MNRPALLNLGSEHGNRLLIVLMFVLCGGQLFLELCRPVCDYLHVLLEKSLFLGCLLEGLEEVIPFPGYFGERYPELCNDGGKDLRVKGLALE